MLIFDEDLKDKILSEDFFYDEDDHAKRSILGQNTIKKLRFGFRYNSTTVIFVEIKDDSFETKKIAPSEIRVGKAVYSLGELTDDEIVLAKLFCHKYQPMVGTYYVGIRYENSMAVIPLREQNALLTLLQSIDYDRFKIVEIYLNHDREDSIYEGASADEEITTIDVSEHKETSQLLQIDNINEFESAILASVQQSYISYTELFKILEMRLSDYSKLRNLVTSERVRETELAFGKYKTDFEIENKDSFYIFKCIRNNLSHGKSQEVKYLARKAAEDTYELLKKVIVDIGKKG